MFNRIVVSASPQGLLLYSASPMLRQFTWLDRSGNPLGTIGEPGEYASFRLSPDNRRAVALVTTPGGLNPLLFDLSRGVTTRFNTEGTIGQPIWSPMAAKS
jgi:hypothetical protein